MRILTYNIWDGGGERLGEIAEVIRAADADAVALQEVRRDSAEALAAALDMELAFGEGNSILDVHLAWLSRLGIRAARNHRLPQLAKTLLAVEVGDLELLTTHLTSRHEVHLFPREGEIAAITGVLNAVARPHLLVGDFNALQPEDSVGTPPDGVQFRDDRAPRTVLAPLRAAGYVDCFRAVHPREPGWTYSATTPWLRLDYAFASPALAPRLRACDVVTTAAAKRASDHLPVVAEFA